MKALGMTQSPDSDFDFEEWAALAKSDPEAFEAKREKAIARFIEQASPHMQNRLRGLQWRIDMVRDRSTNPLSSCMQIFNQMWSSVYGERGFLDALNGVDHGPLPKLTRADVVTLNRHHPDHNTDMTYPNTHT
jgi:Protein of unknown function (DUF3135)